MMQHPEPPTSLTDSTESRGDLVWDGRYQVERTLGEGGMGEVLLARDLAGDGRPVALKVLQSRYREVATPYFMREFVMQRRLRHPGIARVHELGFDQEDGGEVPYFSMQFVPGRPLALLFEEDLALEDIWRWTLELLQALDMVHRTGYLHRDVKPGNILIIDQPGPGESSACLIDFGIAIPLSADREEFFIGTPEYSAPERMACEQLEPASDLYSVALILYELLQGEPPWPGWEPEELWIQRMKKPPPPITREGVPAAVAELIMQVLKPSPGDRPQTAAELIVRLSAALGRTPVVETELAFRQRLEALPLQTASYQQATEAEARLLVLDVPQGHDGSAVLHEIADRASIKGVRVVRVQLRGKPAFPLSEIEPMLDVFRRLRVARQGGQGLAILQGIAGAATMLTRMHRPTMLCLEGLQRADAATLSLFHSVLTGATNEFLSVVATVDEGDKPLTADAFRAFTAQKYVQRVRFAPLTREDTVAYMAAALGPRVMDDACVERFHEESGGSPMRLVQLLTEAFRKGDLRRSVDGYLWLEGAVGPDTRTTRHMVTDLQLFELLSVIDGPLPAFVVQSYLGPRWSVDQLVDAGVLTRTPTDWVTSPARQLLETRYAMMPPLRRRAFHQKLGDVLVALEPFPGRAGLIADQLERTARPAQSVPYLLAAADDAAAERNEARGLAYVDRAARLAEEDPHDDDDRWHWRILLAEAEIDLARRLGDQRRLATAAEQLFRLGVDGAHLSSIEHALVAKMDHAHAAAEWARLVEHAEQLLLLHHMSASGRAVALHRWARSLQAWATGDSDAAAALVAEGLAEADDADLIPYAKLSTLQAELAVASGAADLAAPAIARLRALGDTHGERALVARAGLLDAAWLRRQGRASAALRAVQGVTAEIGASHQPGLNGRVELEFAECHLALGWHESALEHARRAIELSRRDQDPATAFAARSALADAMMYAGGHAVAEKALARMVSDHPPHVMPQLVNEVRWRWLLCRFEQATPGLLFVREIAELAGHAARGSDPWTAARATALAVRVSLGARRARDAVRYAEWLVELQAAYPQSSVPRHLVDWLMAGAHYQLKWFKSASALSRRAMESLRELTQEMAEAEHRRGFLAARDNALVGSDGFEGAARCPEKAEPIEHPEAAVRAAGAANARSPRLSADGGGHDLMAANSPHAAYANRSGSRSSRQ
ncbi:MAG: hypothetical protein CVU56_11880 [Deltaproteobacteria bacterium HGW-Deltaproteobacteria-14]|jgi:tetratricopeptide (TPR) repeat protein|nr:MAG: hypothetical protein CVU56_11880 [Deltaproteobacteria bacterium HGW-Deltaproteobacteria-14]